MASWFNPWTGIVQAWPISQLPTNPSTAGILGSRPGVAPQQWMIAQHASASALPPALYEALTGLTLQSTLPSAKDWLLDTGASSHMAGNSGMLSSTAPSSARIVVDNGASLPVQCAGTATVPTSSSSLLLHDVLVSPSLIKNLISVRRLTRDNSVSIEFDPFGFSIKDLHIRAVLFRSDSSGDLYPLRSSVAPSASQGFHVSVDLWHARLGHPGRLALSRILHSLDFACQPTNKHSCTACCIGKNVRQPFHESSIVSPYPFCLLHCDVWTSPVPSNSSLQYYLVVLDDYSHYVWTFPLRRKSDVLHTLVSFHAFVQTQFGKPISYSSLLPCVRANSVRQAHLGVPDGQWTRV